MFHLLFERKIFYRYQVIEQVEPIAGGRLVITAMTAVIVVLIFGAGRLPQLGKGIGEGIKNFKQSIRGDEAGDDNKKV